MAYGKPFAPLAPPPQARQGATGRDNNGQGGAGADAHGSGACSRAQGGQRGGSDPGARACLLPEAPLPGGSWASMAGARG
jgi:hypothetical protein